MENTAEEIRRRLESELARIMGRLGRTGEIEPSARGVPPAAAPGDSADEEREMGFATRSLLVGKAKKMLNALERLRSGEYGICQECGESIAPRRLEVIPEASTCVRCQDRLDRMAERIETVGARVADQEDESLKAFSDAA